MPRPNENLFLLLFILLTLSAVTHTFVYYLISRLFFFPFSAYQSRKHSYFLLPTLLPDDSPLLKRPAVRRYAHCFAAIFSTGILSVFFGIALKPKGFLLLIIPFAFYIITQILWRRLDRDAFSDTSPDDPPDHL